MEHLSWWITAVVVGLVFLKATIVFKIKNNNMYGFPTQIKNILNHKVFKILLIMRWILLNTACKLGSYSIRPISRYPSWWRAGSVGEWRGRIICESKTIRLFFILIPHAPPFLLPLFPFPFGIPIHPLLCPSSVAFRRFSLLSLSLPLLYHPSMTASRGGRENGKLPPCRTEKKKEAS